MSVNPLLHCQYPAEGLVHLFYGKQLLATVLRRSYRGEGISFFTPGEYSQQLGYMNRPEGYDIPPHDHNPVSRTIEWTQETILMRSGKARLDLYAPETRRYLASVVLNEGDVVLLAHGGHGFHMEEDSELVEIKQGPYAGDADKTRFAGVTSQDVVMIEPA